MKVFNFKSPFTGEDLSVMVNVRSYNNGRPALELLEEDMTYGLTPYAVATVNLPDVLLQPNEILIKDYAENEEKNDNGGPCINMIKYTRICDSAIIPCKSIINSIREFDSAIIPCKFIINSTRQIDSQIDSQIVKNQLAAEKTPLTVPSIEEKQKLGPKPVEKSSFALENLSTVPSEQQKLGPKPTGPPVVPTSKNQSSSKKNTGKKK